MDRAGVSANFRSGDHTKNRGTSWAVRPHTSQSWHRATFPDFRTPEGLGQRQALQGDGAPDGAMRTTIFSNGMLATGKSNVTTPGEHTLVNSTPRLGNG